LTHRGYTFAAADVQGEDDPFILCHCERLLLALGNEAAGLSPALRRAVQARLTIPIDRMKAESLNVAACGAICMYLSARPG
jgi:tRNA G18 (ribose-2'-O)-methylase SpoU